MPARPVLEDARPTLDLNGLTYPTGRPADPAGLVDLRVRCMACGTESAADRPVTVCEVCGGLLDALVPLDRPVRPEDLGQDLPPALRQSGVWRYRPLLPAIPEAAIVTRAEGKTPLYWDDRLAAYAGLRPGGFGLKHEGQTRPPPSRTGG